MDYSAAVKTPVALVILLAGGCLLRAQTNDLSVDDVLDSVQ